MTKRGKGEWSMVRWVSKEGRDAVSVVIVVKASMWEKDGACFHLQSPHLPPLSLLLHHTVSHYQKSICTLVGNVVLQMLLMVRLSHTLPFVYLPESKQHAFFGIGKIIFWKLSTVSNMVLTVSCNNTGLCQSKELSHIAFPIALPSVPIDCQWRYTTGEEIV